MSNELLPGTILYDHYKINECISTAEFSNIYIAEHLKENNKKVIIKELLHKAIGTNDRVKALEKFQKELDIYKKLDHPNMAKVIESFSSESAVYTENKQFIVMEYIEGKTLRKIKEEQKENLPPDDAGKWFCQIMEVIKYLSEQNPPVIFYYLTPDHVMVTDEGEIKLINFGLGRFFRTGPFKSNQYMGIAGYAAPEQYGIKPVDNRADIFGAGAVIYYMLTQDDPEKHALNFSPVRTLNQMVSMQFARFISKCVQMKAEDRCENINEVIEKLNSITFTDTQVSPDKIKKKEGEGPKKVIEKQKIGKEVTGWQQAIWWTINKYIPANIMIGASVILIIIFISFLYKITSSSNSVSNIAYLLEYNGNTIVKLNTTSLTIMPGIKLETGLLGGMAVSSDGKYIYATRVGNKLSIIDTKLEKEVNNIMVKNEPVELLVSLKGDRIYVLNKASNSVTVIDAVSQMVLSQITVGDQPVCASISGETLYVGNYSSSDISVINTVDNKVLKTIPVEGRPSAITYSQTHKKLYVANSSSQTISVINTNNFTVTTTITAPNTSTDINISPDNSLVYVSIPDQKSIFLINPANDTSSGEFVIRKNIASIKFSPDGKYLYICSPSRVENQASVILVYDTKTKALKKEIPTKEQCMKIVFSPERK